MEGGQVTVGGGGIYPPGGVIFGTPIYVVGPPEYPLVDPPATTAKSPATLAMQQLTMLRAIGSQFAQRDMSWSWGNQCDMQAANLQSALRDDKAWQGTRPKLWDVGTTGGTGSLRFGRHNLVVLTPINGNPLPPMTLDSFHGPQAPFSSRSCRCQTLQDFKKSYPDPVDADPWWLVILKHLPQDFNQQ